MADRFCIFSAQYLPHMGGVERYTYYLAKELITKGHEVTVVTSLSEGQKEHEVSEQIEIYRMSSINLMSGRLPVLKSDTNTSQIEKQLKSKGFDFVLINTRFYLMSLYGARFAYKNRIAAGVLEHGTSHLTFNNRIFDVAEKIYEHGITAVLKHYCKDYYGVSKACCEWSAHFGIKSKGVLYNAIDLNEVCELMANPVKSYRNDFHVKKDAVVITFTGRMLIEKGIYELMEAVSGLNSEIILFMAGDGPEFENMKKKAQALKKENIRIIPLGRIDFQHVMALLKETDIYCLPSVSEGFPTSVLEAVAAKCFVITTYNGGARELIKDGVSGMILKNNEADRIRDAIKKALNDPVWMENAKETAYEELKHNFTWESTAARLIELSGQKGNEKVGR